MTRMTSAVALALMMGCSDSNRTDCRLANLYEIGFQPLGANKAYVSGYALNGQACTEAAPCIAALLDDFGPREWWTTYIFSMTVQLPGEPVLDCRLDLYYLLHSPAPGNYVNIVDGPDTTYHCQFGPEFQTSSTENFIGLDRYRILGYIAQKDAGTAYVPKLEPGRCSN